MHRMLSLLYHPVARPKSRNCVRGEGGGEQERGNLNQAGAGEDEREERGEGP